ncbi:MAG TPA: O-antigen ligase family protein [Pyrinomonadaceae bacterium]|nr:O-antigen ligase family protein [Pyrinomonadaceae bacterium]
MGDNDNHRLSAVDKTQISFAERSARVLHAVVFVCLLALMIVAILPYGTVDAWWEAVFECGVFAVTAIWVLEVLLAAKWNLRELSPLIPLILITAYAFAQTVAIQSSWPFIGNAAMNSGHMLSIDRFQTLLTARKMLALMLFLGLLLLHVSSPKRLRWLVRTVIGIGFGSALFAILRQFLQAPDAQMGFVLPFLFYGVGFGQFISPNAFAYLMEMVLGLQIGLLLGGGRQRSRIPIDLGLAAVVWTALISSNSRGGIFALIIQMLFLLFVSLSWYTSRHAADKYENGPNWLNSLGKSRAIRMIIVAILGTTLIAGVFWMGGERFATRVSELDTSVESLDATSRQSIWRSSWELVRHNPISGVGFGTYFLAIPQYEHTAGRLKLEEAHNDYLDLAANGGVVAVGLAAWFVALVISRARRSLRSSDAYRRAAALGAVAGMLSIAAHSLVDFGLQITGIAVVFIALVTVAIAGNSVEQKKVEHYEA